MSQTQYREAIAAFQPANEQEAGDQQAILWYIDLMGDSVLLRENQLGHLTGSGFIMNEALDKVLLVHHNIRNAWAWTGGHADGDGDLLAVALREAMEETGVTAVRPLAADIASIDILPVFRHQKRGRYVNAHLHLSAGYVLICDEREALHVKPDENSGVRWFPAKAIAAPMFSEDDVYLYTKLIRWARAQK